MNTNKSIHDEGVFIIPFTSKKVEEIVFLFHHAKIEKIATDNSGNIYIEYFKAAFTGTGIVVGNEIQIKKFTHE